MSTKLLFFDFYPHTYMQNTTSFINVPFNINFAFLCTGMSIRAAFFVLAVNIFTCE